MKLYKTIRVITGIAITAVLLGGCAGQTKMAQIAADKVAAHEEMALQLKLVEAWGIAAAANAAASVTTIECGTGTGACAGLKVRLAGDIQTMKIPKLTNKHDAAIAKSKSRTDFAKYAIGKISTLGLGWKALGVLDGRSNNTTAITTTTTTTTGDTVTSGDVAGDTRGDVAGDTRGDTTEVGGDQIAGTQEVYDAGGDVTRGDKDQMADSYNQDNDVDESDNSDNSVDNSDNSVDDNSDNSVDDNSDNSVDDNSDNSVDDNSDNSVDDNSVVDDHTVNNEAGP